MSYLKKSSDKKHGKKATSTIDTTGPSKEALYDKGNMPMHSSAIKQRPTFGRRAGDR